MDIVTRPHTAEDLPLVFDTYLATWRISKFAGTVPNHLYHEVQRQALEGLLGRGAKLTVACHENRPDRILGWACSEVKDGRCVVHYLFERDVGLEVATVLVASLEGTKPGFVTHKLFFPALRDWTHAPEIARRKSL